jgi:large subunit ribosomal protein L18
MAEGPGHEVPLKRRRDGRTDYGKRREMWKSGHPRAAVRISNNHARVQLIQYSDSGDSVIASAFSGDLSEYGWDGHTGNIPAAYLTGVLAGYRAQEEGVESAVADLGRYAREYGSRHYAALRGLKESGLDIPVDEAPFPANDRVKTEHMDGMAGTFQDVLQTIESEHGDS